METYLDNLWNQVLERLQLQLSKPTFETWIKTATAEQLENNCLVIHAPNPFARNWLQKYYVKTITDVVHDILGYPVEIYLTTSLVEDAGKDDSGLIWSEHKVSTLIGENSSIPKPRPVNLNPKYMFSRFVVGPNNRMAHAASLAVAESPGQEFNPLFLCGGVGLGKTHLMQAIGHYRLEIFPDSQIFYVSTEKFTNDLIAAIRKDSLQSFRKHP